MENKLVLLYSVWISALEKHTSDSHKIKIYFVKSPKIFSRKTWNVYQLFNSILRFCVENVKNVWLKTNKILSSIWPVASRYHFYVIPQKPDPLSFLLINYLYVWDVCIFVYGYRDVTSYDNFKLFRFMCILHIFI